MKVVILAGGFGTRISEESHLKPKPMVEIGEMPILWHIMKIYSHFGFNDFIICLGYKGYIIKEYFANYYLHGSDVTFDFQNNNERIIHQNKVEPWRVTLVETGYKTMTGGRVKRIKPYLNNETFLLTYGDGLSDINIRELVDFHKRHGRLATITAHQPVGRFGVLTFGEEYLITGFHEKPATEGGWVNAGFFVLEPEVLDYIEGDQTVLEHGPLTTLAGEKNLVGYRYSGFWYPMDTLRDRNTLDELWTTGRAPWKIW